MKKDLDILMVGHFAKDKIVVDGKEEICAGGAVYYGAVVLKRLGLEVGVASRGNPEDYPSLQPLMDMGIEFDLHPASQSSGCINIYNSADMDHRICKLFGFAGEIPYEDIPDVNAKIIAILPIIAGEVSLDTLIKLSKKAPIALDVQGFVRVAEGDDLLFKPWKDMEEGLKHVTFLKVDSAEAEYLTGEKDLEKAAKILAGYGPKEIVLTQKKEILVYADGKFYRAPFLPKNLSGRTGRGDTCITSYIGSRIKHDPERATQIAGIITSMKQEVPGPWTGDIDPERFDPKIVFGD